MVAIKLPEDPLLERALEERAQAEGMSPSELTAKVSREALLPSGAARHRDLRDLEGGWNDAEVEAFHTATAWSCQIDPQPWQADS